MHENCSLCRGEGERVLWRGRRLRVIQADDAAYPGCCRVIWTAHVREMTDLDSRDRAALMDAVWTVEAALRAQIEPLKINLASLGNQVPHLHWHVIPRFADDAHFPDAVWAGARRPGVAHGVDAELIRRYLLANLGSE